MEMNDELHVEWAAIREKLSSRARSLFLRTYVADGHYGLSRPMPDVLDLKLLQGIDRFRACGRRMVVEIRMVLATLGKRLPDYPIYVPADISETDVEALRKRETELLVELTQTRQRITELGRRKPDTKKKLVLTR